MLSFIPKETNPPLVFKSSIGSPLNSGGGIGDHWQGGALAHASELPTSTSSYKRDSIILTRRMKNLVLYMWNLKVRML